MPDFSIVIPTYNRAEALDKCLQSLCNQTFLNFEVIVYDDGSDDNTKDIVEQYNSKLNLQYIYADNWGGPARPRNMAIKQAKGEWICFLDSDDWWFPNKLAVCEKYTNDYDFIFHETSIYIDGKPTNKGLLNKFLHFNHLRSPKNILRSGNYIACSSVCVRRKLILENLFPEDKTIIALEDYYTWISLLCKPEIKAKFLNQSLSAYLIHSNNISAYNRRYLSKLFAFKHKLESELDVDVNKSCLNYLIGVNLLELKKRSRANVFFKFAIANASSLTIKIKSLIRLLT